MESLGIDTHTHRDTHTHGIIGDYGYTIWMNSNSKDLTETSASICM